MGREDRVEWSGQAAKSGGQEWRGAYLGPLLPDDLDLLPQQLQVDALARRSVFKPMHTQAIAPWGCVRGGGRVRYGAGVRC